MKHITTTNETHPAEYLQQRGCAESARGETHGYDWYRYTQRDGKSCLAVVRTIDCPPDGYDYQMICGTMQEINTLHTVADLQGWGCNINDLDAVLAAHYAAMHQSERDAQYTAIIQ